VNSYILKRYSQGVGLSTGLLARGFRQFFGVYGHHHLSGKSEHLQGLNHHKDVD